MGALPSTRPLCSIVIVCFGQRAMTERCLESLDRCLGSSLGAEIELVLVDNASPDDTLELLDAWEDRATVLRLPENRNFAGGCNAGAQAATGQAVVFLNNDTVVEPGVLEELAATALEPGVAAAGPRLLYANGTVQHAGVVMVRAGRTVSPFHIFHHQDGQLPAVRAVFELDCVTGACLAVRRDVFLSIGEFDEAYRNGYEDVDLCLRLRTAGHRIVYRGDLSLLHDEGATRAGHDDKPNQIRFVERWADLLDPDVELAAGVWGCELSAKAPNRVLPAGAIVLGGPVNGVGGAGDETRALLVGFARAGIPVTAIDVPTSFARAPVAGEVAEVCRQAQHRTLPASAPGLALAEGPASAATAPTAASLRLARAAWGAAERDVISADPADACSIPPAIVCQERPGPGGGGVLAILPAHDRPALERVLEGLAAAALEVPVRVVPTVGCRGLAEIVDAHLPDAELLPVASHDGAWEALARTADVAVCLDADDAFDRRALLAAAAGATPIVLSAAGPAGATLCGHVVAAGPAELPGAIARAYDRGDRAIAAEKVRQACDPQRVATRIAEHLGAVPVFRAA